MAVTTKVDAAMEKKSGMRQREAYFAIWPTKSEEANAIAAPTKDPPMKTTNAAANPPAAPDTIQRGKGLGCREISRSLSTDCCRVTPPATMSETSWCT